MLILGNIAERIPNVGRDGATNFEGIRRALVGANSIPSRMLQAAAAAHNREMHALNGNIYFCSTDDETRVQTVERLRDASDRGDWVRRGAGIQTLDDAWSASARTLSALIARRSTNVGRQTTSSLGTQHCFAGRLETLEVAGAAPGTATDTARLAAVREEGLPGSATPGTSGVSTRSAAKKAATSGGLNRIITPAGDSRPIRATPARSPSVLGRFLKRLKAKITLKEPVDSRAQSVREAESLLSTVEEVFRNSSSVGDKETGGHRDGLTQLPEWIAGKYWYGVGTDRKFNVATLSPTSEAANLLAKEQDPGARDARLNARFPQRVWSYVQDCGVLQIAAVDGASASRCDIRCYACGKGEETRKKRDKSEPRTLDADVIGRWATNKNEPVASL
ncbi:hypothetical protein ACJJTC_001833 [Scirpophaga incertulas]